nr:AKH2 [Galleria mellonella]
MSRVIMFLLLAAVVLVVAEAQLTFSTGWGNGKRSINQEPDDACATEETIYVIYKLIQSEAEKFIACKSNEPKN